MPFHYYLEIRADWIKANIGEDEADEPYKVHVQGEGIEKYHAETLTGGST